jgi:hypothetical protein
MSAELMCIIGGIILVPAIIYLMTRIISNQFKERQSSLWVKIGLLKILTVDIRLKLN